MFVFITHNQPIVCNTHVHNNNTKTGVYEFDGQMFIIGILIDFIFNIII